MARFLSSTLLHPMSVLDRGSKARRREPARACGPCRGVFSLSKPRPDQNSRSVGEVAQSLAGLDRTRQERSGPAGCKARWSDGRNTNGRTPSGRSPWDARARGGLSNLSCRDGGILDRASRHETREGLQDKPCFILSDPHDNKGAPIVWSGRGC